MREVLFRGKTPRQDEHFDDGEWVEGFYTRFNGKEHRIYSGYAETDCGDYYPDWYNVRPETVGQYTGLTVPSGKIFEHDIVTAKFKSNGARFNFIVKYSNENGCYVFDNGRIKAPFCEIRSVRIIGNIHDNPELLKGE